MSALLELAERCTGADRELDAAIARATGAANEQPDGTWLVCFERGYSHSINPPAFTASLDAAMTLVPEGWHWSLRKMPLSGYLASLFVVAPNGSDRPYVPDTLEQVEAKTAALALCAAALRARAILEGEDECPSCGGLNKACPEGCGRNLETGELDGTALRSQSNQEEKE